MRTLALSLFFFSIFCARPALAQDFDNYSWSIYNTKNGCLKDDDVRDIIFDTKGNAWVTTSMLSLVKFDGKTWTPMKFPDMKFSWWLNDIEIDNKGRFLIAGYLGFLLIFDPAALTWDSVPTPGKVQLWKIAQNKKGVFLVGSTISDGGKIFIYKDGKFDLLEDGNGDPFGITIEPNGNALISFRKGLYRYKILPDGTYEKGGEKLSDIGFYETALDKSGTIWAASYDGTHLFSYDGVQWTEYKDAPESIFYDYNGQWKYCIHNVMVLPDDRVMITTQFGCHLGIYDPKKKEWKTYSLPVEVKSDGIERLNLRKDGSLWIATWRNGLAVFRPNGTGKVLDPVIVKPESPPVEKKDLSFLPDPSRNLKGKQRILVESENAEITIVDAQIFDGDSISIYLNGLPVVVRALLTKTPATYTAKLLKGDNELILYAHNEGKIPPNTVSVTIRSNGKVQQFVMNSDLHSTERVILELK
jgi:ligand-binding sensor domain-containing protein